MGSQGSKEKSGASALKMAFIIFIFEKIGYHSNFNFECNTERGSIDSLSIALGARAKIRTFKFVFLGH